MAKYRIVTNKYGKFTVEEERIYINQTLIGMFKKPEKYWSASFDDFETIEGAENYIRERIKRNNFKPEVIKEIEG